MSLESEGQTHIRKARSKPVHDQLCDCDCWPCFYTWDDIEPNEAGNLYMACYSCLGAGCNDCRNRWLEDQ